MNPRPLATIRSGLQIPQPYPNGIMSLVPSKGSGTLPAELSVRKPRLQPRLETPRNMARTRPFIFRWESRDAREQRSPEPLSSFEKRCSVWVEPIRTGRRRPESLRELARRYGELRTLIRGRIDEFLGRWRLGEEAVFAEMCFCLLTPQSSALRGLNAVCRLEAEGLLGTGTKDQVEERLVAEGVRFAGSKASYIIRNREVFMEGDGDLLAETLSLNEPDTLATRRRVREMVLGFGPKEATHFLRNIGVALGSGMAILDRHIQRELVRFGYLESAPRNLSNEKNYETLEQAMRQLSRDSGVPMDELDLLVWANRTGIILK